MSFLEGKQICIVGGAGFVGSNLVKQALELGVRRILIIDNLLSSEAENVPQDKRIEFIEGSISDENILVQLADEHDFVFHLATFHGNQNSIERPLEDLENNVVTTLKLFDRIKQFNRLEKVVYSGSGCVLAPHTNETPEPVKEEGLVPFDLDSPYQISKVVGEFYARYFWRHYELPTVRARFQNVYGPGEVLGAGKWRGTAATVWRNVVPVFIYKALKNEKLPVEGEGKATRDFIYVSEVVRGLILCAERGLPGEVYNLASGREHSINDLARLINELTDNKAPVDIRPRRAWDQSGRRVGSTEKARLQLEFEADKSLRSGIEDTIHWTRANLTRIDSCIRKHAERIEEYNLEDGRQF